MYPFVQTLLSFPVYVLSVLILGFSTEKSRFALPREKTQNSKFSSRITQEFIVSYRR